MKKSIRILLMLSMVLLLAATTAVQTARAAVSYHGFFHRGTGYTIVVTPSDVIINLKIIHCDGTATNGSIPFPVSNISFQFSDPLYLVQTVWQNNGTVTDVSGACGGGMAEPNHYRQTVSEDAAGSLVLEKPKNGRVDYAAGTCSGNCSISPTIPTAAKKSLPDGVVATLYFREIDANGDPATGAYNVCFDVGDLSNPVVYRYVSGAWVAQPASVVGGQVCASASSSGVWALGGN